MIVVSGIGEEGRQNGFLQTPVWFFAQMRLHPWSSVGSTGCSRCVAGKGSRTAEPADVSRRESTQGGSLQPVAHDHRCRRSECSGHEIDSNPDPKSEPPIALQIVATSLRQSRCISGGIGSRWFAATAGQRLPMPPAERSEHEIVNDSRSEAGRMWFPSPIRRRWQGGVSTKSRVKAPHGVSLWLKQISLTPTLWLFSEIARHATLPYSNLITR